MAPTELIQIQYNKALRYFLLTKYNHAATACVKALSQLPVAEQQDEFDILRVQLWVLYLNIITITLINASTTSLSTRIAKQFGLPLSSMESFDHFTLAVWDLLVKSYGNIAGNCDPRIVSAYLLMTLKLKVPAIGRQTAEQWFATLSDVKLDYLGSLQGQEEEFADNTFMMSYLELVDIYATRILPEANDFESAKSFIEYNSFLTDEKKESIIETIQTMKEDQQKEQEKKKKLALQKKEAEKAAQAAKLAAMEKERQQRELENEQKEKIKRENEQAAAAQAKQQQKERQKQQQFTPTTTTTTTTTTTRSTNLTERSPKAVTEQSLHMIKTWINQLTTTGSAAYVAVLIVFFALLSLLRGPRSRLSNVLKLVLTKFWQTIQMGTKVTYM
ncbi:hypothetical protein BJ944DRAFT_167695 [Cunninghamella echinulata]|nr:hypothetical protein BJ944DRAFT_167695 [Cunninghamella echinulata]